MTASELQFTPSASFTLGVELELQILNSRDFNLARDAADLINLLGQSGHPGAVKPEITESMVELNTSIHASHESLVRELEALRDETARKLSDPETYRTSPASVAGLDAHLRELDASIELLYARWQELESCGPRRK